MEDLNVRKEFNAWCEELEIEKHLMTYHDGVYRNPTVQELWVYWLKLFTKAKVDNILANATLKKFGLDLDNFENIDVESAFGDFFGNNFEK